MADPFERLPTETRLSILKRFPDLSSLDRATSVSTSLRLTFEAYPVDVAGSIISFYTLELRQMMCYYCLPENRHFQCSFLNRPLWFNNGYGAEATVSSEEFGNPLPRGLPLSAIQRLVHTSRNIETLTKCFLKTYLQRLTRLKAAHPTNHKTYRNRLPLPHNEGHTYEFGKTDSASWIEKYRLVRALWHVLVIYDSLGENYDWKGLRADLSLSPEFSDTRRYVSAWMGRPIWEVDEVKCVGEFISEIHGLPVTTPVDSVSFNDHNSLASLIQPPKDYSEDVALSDFVINEDPRLWDQYRQAAKSANIY